MRRCDQSAVDPLLKTFGKMVGAPRRGWESSRMTVQYFVPRNRITEQSCAAALLIRYPRSTSVAARFDLLMERLLLDIT